MAMAVAAVAAPSGALARAVETEAAAVATSRVAPGMSWGKPLFKHRASSSSRGRKGAFCVCLLHGLGGSFWDGHDSDFSSKKGYNREKDKEFLLSMVEQIEPLDVSSISKEASVDSMDAMKRTISGMLGLLPSDQFKVTIEAYREPLTKLLVSSMMTGYTLRNAEYRLSLQRSLQLSEEDLVTASATKDMEESLEELETIRECVALEGTLGEASTSAPCVSEQVEAVIIPGNLGSLSPEAVEYVSQLQAKMVAVEKELEDCKRAKTALEMEKIVGDEKNDLLDYLRSLEPEKVAELSHPASKDVEEVIQKVIDDLLKSLCKSRQSKPPSQLNGGSSMSDPWTKTRRNSTSSNSSSAEMFANNVPLKFQSTATATRDYLARLLFWCMLMGHHIRGLEYRMELSHALSLTGVSVEE